MTPAPSTTATPEPGATDPDFSRITDILGGERHLLRDDDLIVLQTFLIPDNENSALASLVLQTADSTVTQVLRRDLPGMNPNILGTGLDVGRMFDLPNDVSAALEHTSSGLRFDIYDPGHGTNLTGAVPGGGGYVDFAAMADFTGDEYADLVVHDSSRRMRIASAEDVTQMTAGLRWGDSIDTPASECDHPTGQSCSAFAVGDFRGDGQRQIALVQTGPGDRGLALTIFTVDPITLAMTPGSTVTLPIPDASAKDLFPVLTAGRFGTIFHDQLVLAYGVPTGSAAGNYRVVAIDFDGALVPSVKAHLALGTFPGGAGPMVFVLKSGRLDWSGQFDQAVLFVADDGPDASLRVLTFDQNLNIADPGKLNLSDLDCGQDIALGNFDRMQPNPQPPPDKSRDPNLQLAILWQPGCNGLGSAQTFAVNLYDLDLEHHFEPKATSTFTYHQDWEVVELPRARLVAGDTRGRSLMVGAPQKVTISAHIQPDIVLGIPPMHIDYIRDANNLGPNGRPQVLNLTVIPSLPFAAMAFDTQYSFSATSSMTASRRNTTSYSFSTDESVGTKFSYGVPDVASISAEVKLAAKQTHDSKVAKSFDTYSEVTSSLTATTGFADHLFFTESRFNIYYYPVLGKTVCPAAKPTCTDNEKLPLYVQFSGPDMVTQWDLDATTQEWYQPPWEPGNVFSYPWNLPLLQQAFPGLLPLTTNPAPWRGTDTSSSAYLTTWSQDSGRSQSSGAVSTHSTDVSVSVTGGGSIEGFGINGSAGFEVNSSQSVSTLNTSSQKVSASTGIQVNKPDFREEVADTYLYEFGGYVFGRMPPAGTVQTIPLHDTQGHRIDIQGTGPLMVGFVADPRRDGLPWWTQAYTRPDVGLSHPERWDWSKSTEKATFNFRDSNTLPQDDPFYHIKGFFITPADSNGLGPQRTTAVAGEQLKLQARVYNFSLVDMPEGTVVHVRFYGQVYDNAELVGNSFLIGEDAISPIPGFNSPKDSLSPNWALAGTTFDTTGHADEHLIFWALVWMEDAQGDLVPELEGHGLAQNPKSLSFAQITDVPVEEYSNNVGFYGYNTPFFIAPPGSPLGGEPSKEGDLSVESLSVAADPIALDTKVKVVVRLRTGDAALGPLLLVFYDGDPQHGGTAFDVRQIPALRANSTYVTRVFFRPQTAGEHRLFVVAGPRTAFPAAASVALTVVQ